MRKTQRNMICGEIAMRQELLNAHEVADWLRISLTSVYKLVRTKQIEAVRVLNKFRFDTRSIESYLEKNKTP
jgi:excisionase family DNA binding protein